MVKIIPEKAYVAGTIITYPGYKLLSNMTKAEYIQRGTRLNYYYVTAKFVWLIMMWEFGLLIAVEWGLGLLIEVECGLS